jgi:hypothetical protein
MSGGLAEHVYQKTIQMFGSSPEPAFRRTLTAAEGLGPGLGCGQ